VLPDADLDAVIPALAPATMTNNGQTGMDQTRVLAHRERYAEVVEAAAGDDRLLPGRRPRDPDVFIGPLISHVQRRRVEGLHRQAPRRGRAARARLPPVPTATAGTS
jgi:acyl-CoA reductase-like NAD-dependent aldehyde dehydrogenase